MDKFIAEFDPLVALEAEYAAVVARTRVPRDDPASDDADDADDQTDEKRAPEPTGESDGDDHHNDDDDDDLFDGAELYVPLAADSDEEYDDNQDDEPEELQQPVNPTGPVAAAPPAPMDETTKQSIMAAMQSLQLQAPSWARDAAIPDDELVELVQRRLQRSAPPQEHE